MAKKVDSSQQRFNNYQLFSYDSDSLGREYLVALYFTLSSAVTVGFGDVGPFSPLTQAYCCVFLIFGVWAYTNCISFFTNAAYTAE